MLFRSDGKIEISDRGKGISPENLTKITKKFFREDPKTWDNSMGLGLFIVNYILALHDSELEVESELEYGSKFSFKLYNNIIKPKDEENV